VSGGIDNLAAKTEPLFGTMAPGPARERKPVSRIVPTRLAPVLLILALLILPAPAARASVGFEAMAMPMDSGSPIPVAIWYPADAPAAETPLGLFRQTVATDAPVAGSALPLVVISHGSGGSKDGHYDTALALAKAGFVVAALEHDGDNYRDHSGAADIMRRPARLVRLIDYMLGEWRGRAAIDPARIGAFGFSAGGFAVLAAAGGRPDFGLVARHCAEHPQFFDCKVLADSPGTAPPAAGLPPDRRIKALVVAAPALGFTFANGLAGVTQPVQLWRADDDRVLPAPFYADAVRASLPSPPEFHPVAGADHFDFLAPCSERLAQLVPIICRSAPGFDRAAFHAQFNDAVVAFFRRALTPG
jgi:predicted dienelactone hydrolase